MRVADERGSFKNRGRRERTDGEYMSPAGLHECIGAGAGGLSGLLQVGVRELSARIGAVQGIAQGDLAGDVSEARVWESQGEREFCMPHLLERRIRVVRACGHRFHSHGQRVVFDKSNGE